MGGCGNANCDHCGINMSKKIKLYHQCNCPDCDKNTGCFICSTMKDLDRCHIIPRWLVKLVIPQEFREEWLSFEGNNVFTLCKNHHRLFDAMKLSKAEFDIIKDIVADKLSYFTKIVEVIKNRKLPKRFIDKINGYAQKQNILLTKYYAKESK